MRGSGGYALVQGCGQGCGQALLLAFLCCITLTTHPPIVLFTPSMDSGSSAVPFLYTLQALMMTCAAALQSRAAVCMQGSALCRGACMLVRGRTAAAGSEAPSAAVQPSRAAGVAYWDGRARH